MLIYEYTNILVDGVIYWLDLDYDLDYEVKVT